MSSRSLEDVLDTLYKGRANVAKQAKALGISTEVLKEEFRAYVALLPFDPKGWEEEEQVRWPYTT